MKKLLTKPLIPTNIKFNIRNIEKDSEKEEYTASLTREKYPWLKDIFK